MLLFMIILIWDNVVIDDYVDMRWCWCWEWHWDEMMLIMTLRWDVVDVKNAIVIIMLCMYMRGAVTMMDISGGGNRVVKEF